MADCERARHGLSTGRRDTTGNTYDSPARPSPNHPLRPRRRPPTTNIDNPNARAVLSVCRHGAAHHPKPPSRNSIGAPARKKYPGSSPVESVPKGCISRCHAAHVQIPDNRRADERTGFREDGWVFPRGVSAKVGMTARWGRADAARVARCGAKFSRHPPPYPSTSPLITFSRTTWPSKTLNTLRTACWPMRSRDSSVTPAMCGALMTFGSLNSG